MWARVCGARGLAPWFLTARVRLCLQDLSDKIRMVSKVVQNMTGKKARKPQIDMYLEMLTSLQRQQQPAGCTRQMPAAAPCAPGLPLPQKKLTH